MEPSQPSTESKQGGPCNWGVAAIRKLVWALSLMLGLTVLTFALVHVAPGDPARIILGPNASESSVVELRSEMGLDRSVIVQFSEFLKRTVTAQWGDSWLTRRPVLTEIGAHLRPTLSLGILASLTAISLALITNTFAFLYPRWGRFLIPTLRLGIALPSFVVSVAVALALSGPYSWLSSGIGGSSHSLSVYFFPSLAVALYPACVMSTLLRDRIRQIMDAPFYRAGIASGYSRSMLLIRILLANAWPTLITAWVNQISLLVYSTLIVEYVFSFRGLGTLLIASVQGKDLPVLSGIILLNGFFFLLVQSAGTFLSGEKSAANKPDPLRPETVQTT